MQNIDKERDPHRAGQEPQDPITGEAMPPYPAHDGVRSSGMNGFIVGGLAAAIIIVILLALGDVGIFGDSDTVPAVTSEQPAASSEAPAAQ